MTTPTMRRDGLSVLEKIEIGDALAESAALNFGAGTNAAPLSTSTADKNFIDIRMKSSATSGTSRGSYKRLYLSGGAGGECDRIFTTCESDTPADTVNAIHASTSYGSSAGNCTGLATAVRSTLHVPNRSLAGTTCAIQAELYADGASSANGGTMSLIRAIIDGNATGKAALSNSAAVLNLSTGGGDIVQNQSAHSVSKSMRIIVDGTTYYIGLSTAI